MANTLDNLKVGDLVKCDGMIWRVTEINGEFSVCFENTDKTSPMGAQAIMGKWKESFSKMRFECITTALN